MEGGERSIGRVPSEPKNVAVSRGSSTGSLVSESGSMSDRLRANSDLSSRFASSPLRSSFTSLAVGDGDDDAATIPDADRREHRVSFRVAAQCVRAWLSLLPASYYKADAQYEVSPEDGRQRMVAGTPEIIVEMATNEDAVEPNFVRELLLTYRFYMDGQRLISLLVSRFHAPCKGSDPTVIQLRVVNVVRRWLKEHYYDFSDNRGLSTSMGVFFDEHIALSTHSNIAAWADTLRRLMQEQSMGVLVPNHLPTGLRRGASAAFTSSFSVTTANAEAESAAAASKMGSAGSLDSRGEESEHTEVALGPGSSDFLSLNPVDVFRQLTVGEVDLFQSITPGDLYAKVILRSVDSTPRLMELIGTFNKVRVVGGPRFCCSFACLLTPPRAGLLLGCARGCVCIVKGPRERHEAVHPGRAAVL